MAIATKTKTFLQESKREFKRVNWPDRQQTIRNTIIVIIVSLVIAAFLGGMDYIFTSIITETLTRF